MTGTRPRKRKWDQDDQGNTVDAQEPTVATGSVETKEDADEPLATAAEIAAKISASLADKGISSDNFKPETKSEEKTIFETLGIETEEKKPEKIIIKNSFTEVLDINESRHRYYLNKATTQDPIESEYSVSIVSKGRYYPDRRLATEKEPPLRLEVSGPDEESVKSAIAKLKDIMEKGPPETIPTISHVSNLLAEKVYLGMEPTEAVPAFAIRGKVLGPQGSFLKHIQTQTGCKIHLRGKGSGYVELGATDQDINDPLHLYISGTRREELQQAKQLAEDLIAHVKRDVDGLNAAATMTRPPIPQGYGHIPPYAPPGGQYPQYYNYAGVHTGYQMPPAPYPPGVYPAPPPAYYGAPDGYSSAGQPAPGAPPYPQYADPAGYAATAAPVYPPYPYTSPPHGYPAAYPGYPPYQGSASTPPSTEQKDNVDKEKD